MAKDTDEEEKIPFMVKVATFIVDKRNLFFLIFIIAAGFCIFSRNWVKVEQDITRYLPESTETRQGIDLMDEQFITYGTASVMVSNITYDTAEEIEDIIAQVPGVHDIAFDDSTDHYRDSSALFSVTFDGTNEDPTSVEAVEKIRELLSGYDTYISSEAGSNEEAQLDAEMNVVTVIAAVIIVAVLTFTSKTFAEVPVLIITFLMSALLNMGTNFLCGTISYISNSVTIVLQLALAIDYAIILIHRYTEEHEHLPPREACILALSKAIPEISSSSLTTISGLIALSFMQFRVGADLALVLIKAIFLSLLSVFTLMPGLIMLFAKLIDNTGHKNFVPKISAVGAFAHKTRFIVPPVFVALIIVGAVFSNKCPYAFGVAEIATPHMNEAQLADKKIKDTFGSDNLLALVVPAGDYDKEARLIEDLTHHEEVSSVTGLANTEALDGYMLTDRVTPRQFSEIAGIDYEVAELVYAAYAIDQENYGEVVNGLGSYGVPLIDMFLFTCDEVDKGYVTLDAELKDKLDDLKSSITRGKDQLKSDEYTRILLFLNLPEEGEETFAFLETIHREAEKYYPADSVYCVGNSTSDRDLSESFATDNILNSGLSALFVIIVLLFTFNSAGLPVLLIMVIQGSIWLNFSFPYFLDTPLYFLGYLIVSSIQMGANIDYAIVISSRFMDLKDKYDPKTAITETLNQAFPTIITSGAILAAAGLLIGQLSTNGVISSLGTCLGRGTIISIILVMGVLPQVMLIGAKIIEKTSFTVKLRERTVVNSGRLAVAGMIHGHVNGRIDGVLNGVIVGDVDARIDSKSAEEAENAEGREVLDNE
ncbi:MAG: MMPL family transporter [Oscillospiraceae bacterium]|nr:MMPL family transporter [Oscillospiraceae bacterium]